MNDWEIETREGKGRIHKVDTAGDVRRGTAVVGLARLARLCLSGCRRRWYEDRKGVVQAKYDVLLIHHNPVAPTGLLDHYRRPLSPCHPRSKGPRE